MEVGDTYFIEAGTPHAIGGGCFVAEVQEPSDITVGARKLREASPEEQLRHRDRLLGCYHYDGADYEENLKKYRIPPQTVRRGDWGKEQLLIGPGQTEYFSFTRLDLTGETELVRTGYPQVAIVLSGSGTLFCGGCELPLKQADELFFPNSCGALTVRAQEGEALSLLLCNPAGVSFTPEKYRP